MVYSSTYMKIRSNSIVYPFYKYNIIRVLGISNLVGPRRPFMRMVVGDSEMTPLL